MSRSLAWYAQRLRRMSPAEVVSRLRDRARQARWSRRRVRPGAPFPSPRHLVEPRLLATPLPAGAREQVPPDAARRLVAAADRILAGQWDVLGVPRPDVADPDWFLDPVTGRRAPSGVPAFRIDHRDEGVTGNVKSVWELSRHHHVTVLATAWWLTQDNRYAVATADQLRSWWVANPFLSGVHWTSGIELGVRLTSWVWIRRLLEDWPGVVELFEDNPVALDQIRWHQEYLAAFRSRGSSANNHVIAEATGLLAAACAFPWFSESATWRRDAAHELERELTANTFPSGVNRELATDYHRFVTELGLVALVEADAAGHPLSWETRDLLVRSLDVAASLLDVAGNPPRQGDGDEGRALVLDDPAADPWALLLACGESVVGGCSWWPEVAGSVSGALLGSLVARGASAASPGSADRPTTAPQHFRDAGVHVLRTPPGDRPEIWCRCDGGPHGFLSIAAHAHADALSVEVRHDGVDLLVDPGTYCYHGEPEWRRYFRSTRAHNTVEVDGQDQAEAGGPFMWTAHADSVVDRFVDAGGLQVWAAHQRAYARLDPALCHAREVVLDGAGRRILVSDTLTGGRAHRMRMSWHLGPDVTAAVGDGVARLAWTGRDGEPHGGVLCLPGSLEWSAHRGEATPPLGWYSPRFGARVPTTTLVGEGAWTGTLTLRTELLLDPAGTTTDGVVPTALPRANEPQPPALDRIVAQPLPRVSEPT